MQFLKIVRFHQPTLNFVRIKGISKTMLPVRSMASTSGGYQRKSSDGDFKYGAAVAAGLGTLAFAFDKYRKNLVNPLVAKCDEHLHQAETDCEEEHHHHEGHHEESHHDEKAHHEEKAEEEQCGCPIPEPPCGELPPAPPCGETCIHRLECIEECIAKANSDLESVLRDVKGKAQSKTEEALKLLCEAKDFSQKFLDKGYDAIENDSASAFCEIYEIAESRCEKMKLAIANSDCAWELLCRLRETLDAGKCCKYTKCNPLLITTEQFINCAERELVNARSSLDCVKSSSHMACLYCSVISAFKAELQSEVPEECGCDCLALLKHAYRKLINIQKEMALLQICNEECHPSHDASVEVQVELHSHAVEKPEC